MISGDEPNMPFFIFFDVIYRPVPKPFFFGVVFKSFTVKLAEAKPRAAPHVATAIFEEAQYLILYQPLAGGVFFDGVGLGV